MRNDPFAFYSIVIASFLESTAATFVANLKPLFGDNPKLYAWLEESWLADELEHGRLTREYVQRHWPEFDWSKAYAAFYDIYEPRCRSEALRKTPGLEALSRCVVEAETSMIYRCLGSNSNDPELKAILRKLSSDEVRHYKSFKRAFFDYDSGERLGFLQKFQIVFNRSRLVRDEDLAMAFSTLENGWNVAKPFPEMDYRGFQEQLGAVMKNHFPMQEAGRMLFKPLKTGSRLNRWAISAMEFMLKRLYPKMV